MVQTGASIHVTRWSGCLRTSAAFESIRTEPEEFIDAGERVVVPHTHYFQGRDGIEVHARNTWLVTLRDGAIVLIRLYREREQALEAAGLSE
jgi:ketosteroid isomerase-like protein